MNSPESPLSSADDRRLQQLFRDETPDYLSDAGFTARVLGRLPVARRHRERRRWLLLGAAVLLGAALAGLFGGPDLAVALAAGWAWAVECSTRPIPRLETVATVGTLVFLAGALGVAWWGVRREA